MEICTNTSGCACDVKVVDKGFGAFTVWIYTSCTDPLCDFCSYNRTQFIKPRSRYDVPTRYVSASSPPPVRKEKRFKAMPVPPEVERKARKALWKDTSNKHGRKR